VADVRQMLAWLDALREERERLDEEILAMQLRLGLAENTAGEKLALYYDERRKLYLSTPNNRTVVAGLTPPPNFRRNTNDNQP
jgi:hypothetical protein